MGKKEEKTNVMRILDQKKIPYGSHNYLETGAVSGLEVAGNSGKVQGALRICGACQ